MDNSQKISKRRGDRAKMSKKWTRREYRDPKNPKNKIIEIRLFSGEIIKLVGENIRVEKYDIEIPAISDTFNRGCRCSKKSAIKNNVPNKTERTIITINSTAIRILNILTFI